MGNSNTLYAQLKNEVVSRIAALNLQSDDGTWGINNHVYSHMGEDLLNTQHPCVIVTTEGETVTEWGGNTLEFYHWYPVRVLLVDTESMRQHDREPDYHAWLKDIHEEFNNKIMATVPEVQRCLVDMRANFQPRLSQYQYLAGSMLLRFFIKEPRNTEF